MLVLPFEGLSYALINHPVAGSQSRHLNPRFQGCTLLSDMRDYSLRSRTHRHKTRRKLMTAKVPTDCASPNMPHRSITKPTRD